MRIALTWLKALVDVPDDLHQLREVLDMSGLEVADIEDLASRLDGVVAARIRAVTPVDGTKLHKIVLDCGPQGDKVALSGAPNVSAASSGHLVACALPGAAIRVVGPEGHAHDVTVEPRTMHGIISEAVLVSERELGLSDDHSGALYLSDALEPGSSLAHVLGDVFLDVELTPDLGRCFSAWGLAREIGALFRSVPRVDALVRADVGQPRACGLTVRIDDPALCHRYLGGILRGVSTGPSPAWMQRRLLAGGMRPINKLVDIANYVMLEMGQPLHFFDLDTLSGTTITVRQARSGEVIPALNGEACHLVPPMLVIADAAGPVAIAGVIGGSASAVDASTTAVLLEAAHFDGANVRRTCQALKLRTDAAERFIKGIDDHWTFEAMRRAVHLVLELCPGATFEGYQDTWPVASTPRTLDLSERDVARLLGIHLPSSEIAVMLSAFGFDVTPVATDTLRVKAPTYRMDVEHKADLIEEVARGFGMNNIPPSESGWAYLDQTSPDDALVETQRRLAGLLCGLGFSEAVNYSLVSRQDNEFGASFGVSGTGVLALANPLNSERDVLRTSLIPGLLRNVGDNLRYRSGVHLFELGRAYMPQNPLAHTEVELVALVAAGTRRAPYWGHADPGTAIGEQLGLFDIKGIISALLHRFGAGELSFEHAVLEGLAPGQTMLVRIGAEIAGYLGEVDAPWRSRYEADGARVFVAELRLAPFVSALAGAIPQFKRLPTQPAVLRDISILVPTDYPVGDVLALVRAEGGGELVHAELFDRYRGTGVPDGHHSLAMHLVFQHPLRTLQAAEVDERVAAIVASLERRFGARLRG